MPSKTNKQSRFMQIAAHSKEFADKVGIDQSTAREFVEADQSVSNENTVHRPPSVPVPDFVFLGGTTGGYDWRADIESKFTIDAFNPIVEQWTEECKKIEDHAKEKALFNLYVVTPFMSGCYSIAELTESSILYPKNTVVVFVKTLDEKAFDEHQQKSNQAVMDLVIKYGVKCFDNIDASVEFINGAVGLLQEIEANVPSLEWMASATVSHNANTMLMRDPEANAIRWIESHKTLDALKVIMEGLEAKESVSEKEFLAIKRLIRNSMLVIGFYVDSLEYAHDLPALSEVLAKISEDVHAKVLATWKPGMPGYGIE